ncbi:unnamed protein product [Blepharisma stoltei]|uniref:Peroxisomal membrane protein 11B n=1 Tax=Blepharisma stoltei TaxID=1481888 RepID=A0AAU9K3U7_9CILI|nr:unnamed protein product [Blepharisma stoltei]
MSKNIENISSFWLQEMARFWICSVHSLWSSTIFSICLAAKTTKGKEKIYCLIQFLAELYRLTMSKWQEAMKISESTEAIQHALHVEKYMKNGRKLMRAGMFLDDLASINKIFGDQKWKDVAKIIKIFYHICSAIYYALDNLAWVTENSLLKLPYQNISSRLKKPKDSLSFARNIFLITVIIIDMRRNLEIQKRMKANRNIYEHLSKDHALDIKFVHNMIEKKREMKFCIVDLTINSLKAAMSYKTLGLPGSKFFSPIFINLCGIISAALAIYCNIFNSDCSKGQSSENGEKINFKKRTESL